MDYFVWLAGSAVFVVVVLPIASYICVRATSLAHYRSKLEYLRKKHQLGVTDEDEY